MADMNDTINSILNDADAMKQIRELGAMLGIGNNTPAPEPAPAASPLGAMSSQRGSMPDPDMLNMMMKLAPLFGKMNQDNESTRLLYALKPFLSEKRQQRLDQSVRLLGIMNILPLLKNIL